MLQVNLASNGMVIDQGDEALAVRFFMFPMEDEAASKEAGMPCYKDIEMVEIIAPGVKDVFHGKINDHHRARFRRQYDLFKRSATNQLNGTALSEFAFISASERKELEYFNVFTAEQLINMADGNIDKIGVDIRLLIKKVKAHMQIAKDTSLVTRMTEENDKLVKEMNLMKEQMNQILAMKEEAKTDDKLQKSDKRQRAA